MIGKNLNPDSEYWNIPLPTGETIKQTPCLINRHVGTCENCPDKVRCDDDITALHFDNHAGVKNVNITTD